MNWFGYFSGIILLISYVQCRQLPAQHQGLSMTDLEQLVDRLGDEIISHRGLNPNPESGSGIFNMARNFQADTEDMESDFEDDIPHPVGIHNWGSHLKLGQVSGISVNPNDEPVIFHRGSTVWDQRSFDHNERLVNRQAIPNDTILVLDPDTAAVKSAWGKNMFYMPHGITIDGSGNTYVTDVGLHQVMRFPEGSEKPDLVMGEQFVPGNDQDHFCKPTSVAVAESTGMFFVADGYCNSRILKYSEQGKLLKIIKGKWNVVHSLALFEDKDELCLSDREGQKIDCIRAGLNLPKVADLDETGKEVVTYTGVGRSFAVAVKGSTILSVSGSPNVRGITIDTASETPSILDQWGLEEGLTAPHDMAISLTGDAVYVVEIDPKKKVNVHKFEVVRSADFF